MCEGRYRDGGSALHAWTDPEVLVVCPRCSSQAVVVPVVPHRLTCSSCGLAREASGTTSVWGEPVDPWFRAPLWLRAEVRGHTLWAFNHRHLDTLRSYVAAGLREGTARPGAPMSMLEKLPDWMTSARNRDDVRAVLDRLGERAPV